MASTVDGWMVHQLFDREIADANSFRFAADQDFLHFCPSFVESRALEDFPGTIWVLQRLVIHCKVGQLRRHRQLFPHVHEQSSEASASSTVIHPVSGTSHNEKRNVSS